MSAVPQTAPAQATPVSDRSALRASAVYANKVYGPRASQVFNLAASRVPISPERQRTGPEHPGPESPNEATLTSDQEDYPPYSYVYFPAPAFSPAKPLT